jgi:proline dehydrogenase
MSVMRTVLLKGSQSVWLRERAMRWPFVRRAVRRFMPGEELDDALEAARTLAGEGAATILTHLGENLSRLEEASDVTRHYIDLLDRVSRLGLDTQLSVKLTQLGLDQSLDACVSNMRGLAGHAAERRNMVWIDMEGSPYTDVTLEVFRALHRDHANVGVCLQSYLRRTPADLESLLPLGPAIRLVKGAYNEPPDIAFPRKRDVDEQYYALARRLMSEAGQRTGTFLGIGTHDGTLIRRLERALAETGLAKDRFEFEMLYGIRRGEQQRLVREGYRLRVLISYGRFWFPWYMRRLAERPANLAFVARSVFGG